jgi:dihydrofolate reductase (EC 1.5.1.3)
MKPRLSLIVAHTVPGRVIGKDGGMPWHLPADLKHFRTLTWGSPVLMGRRTQESIGRPLPGRTNLVISRQPDFQPDGYTVYKNLEQLYDNWALGSELFVIGGATLYNALLPDADRLFITEIHTQLEGDTFFPTLDAKQWIETERIERAPDDKNSCHLSFITLIRRPTLLAPKQSLP